MQMVFLERLYEFRKTNKRVCTTATQGAHEQAVSVERGDSGGVT